MGKEDGGSRHQKGKRGLKVGAGDEGEQELEGAGDGGNSDWGPRLELCTHTSSLCGRGQNHDGDFNQSVNEDLTLRTLLWLCPALLAPLTWCFPSQGTKINPPR